MKPYQPKTSLIAFDEQVAFDPKSRNKLHAILGGRAQTTVSQDEAARLYEEASAKDAREFLNLSEDEAQRLAALANKNAMLKEFRRVRKNSPCNVCQRLIGNHSDKQMNKCFAAMERAFETQARAKARAHNAQAVNAADVHGGVR